jgi:hypothetical protein
VFGFDWDRQKLIGDKTAEQVLTNDIDIQSRKLNLEAIAE